MFVFENWCVILKISDTNTLRPKEQSGGGELFRQGNSYWTCHVQTSTQENNKLNTNNTQSTEQLWLFVCPLILPLYPFLALGYGRGYIYDPFFSPSFDYTLFWQQVMGEGTPFQYRSSGNKKIEERFVYLRIVRIGEGSVSGRQRPLVHAVFRLLSVLTAILHVDHGSAWDHKK